jgi:hypothetical protein
VLAYLWLDYIGWYPLGAAEALDMELFQRTAVFKETGHCQEVHRHHLGMDWLVFHLTKKERMAALHLLIHYGKKLFPWLAGVFLDIAVMTNIESTLYNTTCSTNDRVQYLKECSWALLTCTVRIRTPCSVF